MKQVVAMLLCLIILSVGIRDLTVMAMFKFNQTQLTDLFCVNKSKPELSCKAKCHLNKVLKQQKQEDSESKQPLPEERKISHFLVTQPLQPSFRVVENYIINHFEYIDLYSFIKVFNIFQPPRK